MKTTKQKLLSIYKKDEGKEFNSIIKEVLIEKFDILDTEEFVINSDYINIAMEKCNQRQLDLLKSIGINIDKSKWSRDMKIGDNKVYHYINRDGVSSHFNVGMGSAYWVPEVLTFKDKEMAEQECKIHNLTALMRNWARFHNEIDKFKPEWSNSKQKKYGITIKNEIVESDSCYRLRNLLFSCAVSSTSRAEEMLKEFKSEIEEVIPYL